MLGFTFTEVQKGCLSICMGVILLLHTFGWFTSWLKGIVLLYAIFLIIYGVVQVRVAQEVVDYIKKLIK